MPSESRDFTTHYADDAEWGPICRMAQDGDLMTFFDDDATCPHCRNILDSYESTLVLDN